MKNRYLQIVFISSIIAAIVGGFVSGSVGALLGFSVFFLIGITGHLISLSVKASDTSRSKRN